MSRRIAWAAWLLVLIQVAGFLLLGPGTSRDLVSNLIQIASCLTAAAFCFSAFRRSRNVARTFWILFSVAFVAYAVSNVVWTYYENLLRKFS